MRTRITTTLLSVVALVASAQTVCDFQVAPLPGESTTAGIVSMRAKTDSAPSRAGGQVTYTIQVNNKPEEMTYYMSGMLRTNAETGKLEVKCGGQPDANGAITWTLSDVVLGKCDVFAIMMDADLNIIFLQKEGAEVTDKGTCILDCNDATFLTELKVETPNGVLDPDETGSTQSWNIVDYKGENLLNLPRMSWNLSDSSMKSNVEKGPYDWYKVFAIGVSHKGIYGLGTKIDFSKPFYGSTADGWQANEQTFASDPFMVHYHDAFSGSNYTSISSMLMYNDEWWSLSTIGCLSWSPYVPGSNIQIWQGEDSPWGVSVYPVGCQLASAESAVRAIPLVMTPDGLRTNGRNLAFDHDLTGVRTMYNWTNGNPRFYEPASTELGNCAPSFCSMFANGVIKYSWTGRHAEVFTIDSFDLEKVVSQDYISKYWGQTSNVVVRRDDKEIFNGRHGFEDIDWSKGDYEIDVVTKNVLIDGTIETEAAGSMKFSLDGVYEPMLPTVTNVQFRNAEDVVTDRFINPADGMVCVYASQIAANTTENGGVVPTYQRPLSVLVEVAPTGTDDFHAIKMSPDPTQDYEGFGSFLSGSLADVTAESATKWFDMRITVKGAKDAEQTQVMRHAFTIDTAGAGIGTVKENNNGIYVVGRNIIVPVGAAIYTLDGVLTSANNVMPGIYVVVSEGKCFKIAVH